MSSISSAVLGVGVLLLTACNPYDAARIHAPKPGTHPGDKDGGSDAMTMNPDAGDGGGMSCMKMPEVCNGMDDDCDGMTDEKAEADADCNSRLKHADTMCDNGACLLVGCDNGYNNCDGEPSNGCEPLCSVCNMCDDAGDDGGTTDAG